MISLAALIVCLTQCASQSLAADLPQITEPAATPTRLELRNLPTTSGSLITQSTYPLESPRCQDVSLDNFPSEIVLENNDVISPDGLLYLMREMMCNGNCSTPAGVSPDVVAIGNDSSQCEIAVGVSDSIEAVAYRGTPAVDVEYQECWDSSYNIIEKCVTNSSKMGWWNGDHVYQFYKLGFRSINANDSAHIATNSSTIETYLPTYDPSSSYSTYTFNVNASETTAATVTTLPTAATTSATTTLASNTGTTSTASGSQSTASSGADSIWSLSGRSYSNVSKIIGIVLLLAF